MQFNFNPKYDVKQYVNVDDVCFYVSHEDEREAIEDLIDKIKDKDTYDPLDY